MEPLDPIALFENLYWDHYDGPLVCGGNAINESMVRAFAAHVLERAAEIADKAGIHEAAGELIRAEAERVRAGK